MGFILFFGKSIWFDSVFEFSMFYRTKQHQGFDLQRSNPAQTVQRPPFFFAVSFTDKYFIITFPPYMSMELSEYSIQIYRQNINVF